jgi:D-alanyl-D-alanine carboxypeptidase
MILRAAATVGTSSPTISRRDISRGVSRAARWIDAAVMQAGSTADRRWSIAGRIRPLVSSGRPPEAVAIVMAANGTERSGAAHPASPPRPIKPRPVREQVYAVVQTSAGKPMPMTRPAHHWALDSGISGSNGCRGRLQPVPQAQDKPAQQSRGGVLGSASMGPCDRFVFAEIDRDETVTGGLAVTLWWSFTKSLIAAAVMRLAETGRIALDDDLPEIGASPRALLQHRAGLPDYGWLRTYQEAVARGDEPWPEDVMLTTLPARFAAGRFSYSNVRYLCLRRPIERATDAPFGTALRELVLSPLGLTARVIHSRDEMEVCATLHHRSYHPAWVYHGLVVGPVAEAAQALHRILASEFLAPSSRAAMLAARPVDVLVEGRPWATTGYRLGLMIGTFGTGNC